MLQYDTCSTGGGSSGLSESNLCEVSVENNKLSGFSVNLPCWITTLGIDLNSPGSIDQLSCSCAFLLVSCPSPRDAITGTRKKLSRSSWFIVKSEVHYKIKTVLRSQVLYLLFFDRNSGHHGSNRSDRMQSNSSRAKNTSEYLIHNNTCLLHINGFLHIILLHLCHRC
ncbi:hypothetical protein BJV74DRAFT_149822 [Russula compacta]|nr:hypothetical protein BJV74DRAFT_149822 [Russula compacta]